MSSDTNNNKQSNTQENKESSKTQDPQVYDQENPGINPSSPIKENLAKKNSKTSNFNSPKQKSKKKEKGSLKIFLGGLTGDTSRCKTQTPFYFFRGPN